MSRSERGEAFHNIHKALYEFVKTVLSVKRAEYLEKVLDWHPDLKADLDGIRTATEFYDADKNQILKKEYYGAAQINKMITVTLRDMYGDTGMLVFEKFIPERSTKSVELYEIAHIAACNGVGFVKKRGVYYDDVIFSNYGSIQSAVNRLKSNFIDLPTTSYDAFSEFIDSVGIHHNNDQTRDTYNRMYNEFGVFGKLLYVAYYSFNKHHLKLPEENTCENVYMAYKKDIETSKRYSIVNRTNGASRIRIVCYTATSFLSSDKVGEAYDFHWHESFMRLLTTMPIDLVLVPPDCKGMADIINYQLRPRVSSDKVKDRTRPFQLNYKKLMRIMDDIDEKEIRGSELNVFFTRCPLTNAYFQCMFSDQSQRDTIKVDMYTPLFSAYTKSDGCIRIPDTEYADDNRPSFVVKPDNNLYTFFSRNIDDIINDSERIIVNSKFVDETCRRRVESFASNDFDLNFDKSDINKTLL